MLDIFFNVVTKENRTIANSNLVTVKQAALAMKCLFACLNVYYFLTVVS